MAPHELVTAVLLLAILHNHSQNWYLYWSRRRMTILLDPSEKLDHQAIGICRWDVGKSQRTRRVKGVAVPC